ncbi:MAG: type secretion system contractile sheath protein TssC [Mucilaginibacter sp.]|nr:type secretion system contractile sheath protein TssC [Mucilaginibacter sp.]
MATPNEQILNDQSSGQAYKPNDKSSKEELSLSSSLEKLSRVGGFDLLEATIEGLQNLNPERKARKQIFLTDDEKKTERDELKLKLSQWIDALENGDSVSSTVEKSTENLQKTEENLNQNLLNVLQATRDLEQSYRSVHLFYKNTEADKLKNVVVMNASLDQLKELDNPRFIEFTANELKQNYDRLDLRQNYSILVIPGYLGSNKVVERWSKIAYDNKVMLVTDFADLEQPDDVIDLFTAANLTGGDAFKSNTIMTCNWLVGRGKVAEAGEEEDLYIPGSAALAGKMYYTLMSQVTAGKKHGAVNEVDGVRFDLKKSEISHLERVGLVPMVNEYGKVMAFSAKTLFNGDNIGLQTYSVVRVFDYITKVLFDFLNRRAFENWNSKTEQDLRSQIVKFLDNIQGPDRLIERFKIIRFERDEQQKDRIHLDINITPYFPAKSFVVKLDGQKGEDENTVWDTEYKQQ